jgi:DnaJ family protein C protein 25
MRRVFVVVAALALCAYAQEEGAEEEKIEETAPQEESRKEKAEKYVYCESDNCYDLLGVKKDAGGLTIKRAYRRLATEWHPDRNPDPRAKDLFQKFANAYEVLSNSEMRKNYDYLLDHPMEFPMHYLRYGGANKYAPKTDAKMVIILTLIVVAVLHHYFLKMQHDDIVKKVTRHPDMQRRLLQLMSDNPIGVSPKKKSGAARQEGGGAKSSKKEAKVDDTKKADAEKKLLEQLAAEELLPPPPSAKDNAAWLLFTLPLYVGYALLFNVSWFVRIRIQKSEYTDADKEYLTGRALVGAELIDSVKVYEGYTDDEKAELVARELWDDDNLMEYKREIKPADKKSGKEKQAARRAKKGGDGGVGMLE